MSHLSPLSFSIYYIKPADVFFFSYNSTNFIYTITIAIYLLLLLLLFSNSIFFSFSSSLLLSSSVCLCSSPLSTSSMGKFRKAERCVSCTTFNILAPIYKRLDDEDQSCRESQYKAYWLSRNQRIIDRLLEERSSIICLQEVWLGNEELVDMYEKRLGDAGYISFKLARANNRGDGLLTAVHRDTFRVVNYKNLHFNDFGDRVALLLHVESVVPFWPYRNNTSSGIKQQMLIVNTHLLFPHDDSLCIIRLKQVYKILQCIESYQREHKLSAIPIVLCGDWNGSKRGHVYKFLRSQGFVSSYDTAHQYTDSDADAHKWVSHRNHRGNICGVDFIWLLNPNRHHMPLKSSWNHAIFAKIKCLLQGASRSVEDAFAYLKANNSTDFATFSGFCQALSQLGLSGPYGLSSDELQDLWAEVDIDSNGVMDFIEFQKKIWRSPKWWEQPEQSTCPEEKLIVKNEAEEKREASTFGFNVKDAVLFPPEVEKGMWPDNYSLSDHAPLTVVFLPVQLPCAQPVF